MTLDEIINPELFREFLREKGKYKLKRTKRFKEVLKFDEYWGNSFNLFFENPFLRVILQYFISKLSKEKSSDRFLDINTILSDFRGNLARVGNCVPESPLLIEVCPNCSGRDFLKKERSGFEIYYCKRCQQQFNSPKMSPSLDELGLSDMYDFLIKLVETSILTKVFQLTCYNCGKIDVIMFEEDVISNIKCNKCNGVKDLIQVFTLVESPTEIKNFESIWLEWYVCRIISEKCENVLSVLPTHLVETDNSKTEVDLLILTKDKQLISIDCKAKSFESSLSKNDIDNNILNWREFSDSILIITTTEFSPKCREFWENQLENIIFVDGKNVERLNEFIDL